LEPPAALEAERLVEAQRRVDVTDADVCVDELQAASFSWAPGKSWIMSKSKQISQAGLVGWREKVADGVAPRAAERGPFSEDQVRNAIGAVFFAISLYYVVSTIARMVRSARG
jgi:hypothetical protein